MREDFEVNPRRPKKTGIIFAISFVVIIALIGLYVLGASSKKEVPIISPTPTSIPTLVPVATSEPTPEEVTPTKANKPSSTPTLTTKSSSTEKNDIEITVLNGSGVTGAAKTIADYLSSLGYGIKSTGNADAYDYQGITILVSKEKGSYLTQLKKDLAEKSATVSGKIDDSLTVDAQVIVGK
jgi:hypothetical protein